MNVQKRTDGLDWNDLRYVLELARHRSLSAAARALKVNHATVARRIAALETALGLVLFERQAKGYRPTADAAPVIAAAEEIEAPLLRLGRLAEARQGATVEGRVRLTATEGIASHVIAPQLASLRRQWPLLEIDMLVEHRALSLARREADLAIRWAKPASGHVHASRLGSVPYRLYRNPAVAADGTSIATFDDSFADLPESRWVRRQASLKPVIRSNSLLPLVEAARAGACCILLPDYIGRQIPELVADGSRPLVTRELWLLVHSDLRKAPRVRAAADFIGDVIRRALKP